MGISGSFFSLSIWTLAFGAITGSFLNVIILRYNTGRTVMGRSRCFSCGRALNWYDLVPIVSYLLWRGRCRTCGSSVSLQYPLVELLTATLFFLLHVHFFQGGAMPAYTLLLLSAMFVTSLFIIIFVYDLRHKIIPDIPVYSAAAFSFALLFVDSSTFTIAEPSIAALVAGPLIGGLLALPWLLSGGRWMGLGDAKLGLSIGWILGVAAGIDALLLAVWIGAFIGVALLLFSKWRESLSHSNGRGLFLGLKNLTIKSEIPFAPFLLLGLGIVYFFDISIIPFIA